MFPNWCLALSSVVRAGFLVGRLTFVGLVLALVAASAGIPKAQASPPLEDTGLVSATPSPDLDLVVVREHSYGAGGVDLTPYGVPGTHHYVQAIYFRFFANRNATDYNSFAGTVTFTPGIRILTIVTDSTGLGGQVDDGTATQTDLLFGVATNPDDYSENSRGFECCGQAGSSEFVCITSDSSFVFGLNIQAGVDDFRVIVDYGDAFDPGHHFSIRGYSIPALGGTPLSHGFLVGNVGSPVVLGSGDFGEAGSLLRVPLTSTEPPEASSAPIEDPHQSVFILRDTPGDTYVDAYDAVRRAPAPDRYTISVNFIGSAVAISEGPGDRLYSIGLNGGYAVIDPVAGTLVTQTGLDDLPGESRDITNLQSWPDLFVLRSNAPQAFVDRLDPTVPAYVQSVEVMSLPDPVGIANGADGRLYLLGSTGALVSYVPQTGAQQVLTPSPIPSGTYTGLTGTLGSPRLFLIRAKDSATHIDVYNLVDATLTPDFAVLGVVQVPVGITDGPSGRLYVIGKGDGVPAGFATVDQNSGDVVTEATCLDFVGTNAGITDLPNDQVAAVEAAPLGARMEHGVQPNPARGASTIWFRLQKQSPVEATIHDVQGRRVRTLWLGGLPAGRNWVSWDGHDQSGAPVPAGAYVYRVQAGASFATGKLVIAR